MKRSFASFLMIAMVAGSGCNQAVPGGPGVTNPADGHPTYGEAEETFNLSVPHMSTSLKQGGTVEVRIGIERGKNFDEDVHLKFADGPKGVTLDSANPVIMHGDAEAKVKIKAADDASLGDFTIKVTGHPTKGVDATNDVKITVAKK